MSSCIASCSISGIALNATNGTVIILGRRDQMYCLQSLSGRDREHTHCFRDCWLSSLVESMTLRPDISCIRTMPNEYTSVLTDTIPFSAYSGARYLDGEKSAVLVDYINKKQSSNMSLAVHLRSIQLGDSPQ